MQTSATADKYPDPRCPHCGFTMCQLFDEHCVNAVAIAAEPNGKYQCYHCTPIKAALTLRPAEPSAPVEDQLRAAFEAGFKWCGSGTDKYGEYDGSPTEDGFANFIRGVASRSAGPVAPQPVTGNERALLHDLLAEADAVIDPEANERLHERITTVLRTCVNGECEEATGEAAAPAREQALLWLVNLHCGVGKAGGEPEAGEWEAAIEAGKAALLAGTRKERQ